MKPMDWLKNILIGLDQLLNALLRGHPDETLSSRAHRMREKGHKYWGWTAHAIDLLLWFDPDHCRTSFENELARKQMPEFMRSETWTH